MGVTILQVIPYFILPFYYDSSVCFYSYFTLAVPMREVSCVGYTLRSWNLRTILSMLSGLLYFVFRNDFILAKDSFKPAVY